MWLFCVNRSYNTGEGHITAQHRPSSSVFSVAASPPTTPTHYSNCSIIYYPPSKSVAASDIHPASVLDSLANSYYTYLSIDGITAVLPYKLIYIPIKVLKLINRELSNYAIV